MVKIIYDQLKTPRSIEELHQRLNELGIRWNKAQIELFLQMDSNIKKTGNLYSVGENDISSIILDIIDQAIKEKPVIPIKKIMGYVPGDVTISAEEISRIAEKSGRYKLHPNGAVLIKVKN